MLKILMGLLFMQENMFHVDGLCCYIKYLNVGIQNIIKPRQPITSFWELHMFIGLYRDAINGLPNKIIFLIYIVAFSFSALALKNFQGLLLLEKYGYSLDMIGYLIALFGLGAIFGTWLAGSMLKMLQYYTVIFIMLALCSIGPLIILIFNEKYSAVIGLFLFSVFANGVRPSFQVALSTSVTDGLKRKEAYTLYRIMINIGSASGMLIGGLLTEISYELLLFYSLAMLVLTSLLCHFTFRHKIGIETYISVNNNLPSTTNSQENHKKNEFLFLLISVSLFSFSMFQLYSFLPVYIVNTIGLSKSFYGTLPILNLFILIAFELYLVRVMHAYSVYVSGILGSMLMSISYIMLSFSISSELYVYLFYGVFSLAISLYFPSIMNAISKFEKDNSNVSFIVRYQYSMDFIVIIGPAISSLIISLFNIKALWLICSASAFCSFIILLMLSRPTTEGNI